MTPRQDSYEHAYQSRYIAYARAHGRTPEAQDAHDDEAWPGGCMTGFILWIGDRWAEWKTAVNWPKAGVIGDQQHREFDEWLNTRASATHGGQS